MNTGTKWRVTATGAVTGNVYVYEVTGPLDATPSEVINHAYGRHGRKLRAGEVTEPLGPGAFADPVS